MNDYKHDIEILDLIAKHIANEASSGEEKVIKEWLKEDESHVKLYKEYKNSWNITGLANTINVSDEWNKLSYNIDNDIYKGKIVPLYDQGRKVLIRKFSKIAAIFLIGLFASTGVYFTIQSFNKTSLQTSVASKERMLPDGTSVTLNSNSLLTYPKKFKKHKRNVLLEGEAYFEVTKNKEKPFVINAEGVEIRVLGTSFYVNTNTPDNTIEVIVNTGKVAVISKEDTAQHILLTLDMKGEFSKTNKTFTRTKNEDVNYLAWKNKMLIFSNTKLSDVIYTINKTYHSNIVFDTALMNDLITVSFNNQSLDTVLSVIAETLNAEVVKENGVIQLTQ